VSTVHDAATTDHGEPTIYDFVVVSTKQLPDVYSTASLVAPVITPSRTTVVLIQNGLDVELPLIAAFPTNSIMSAVSMIGSSTAGPNRVIQIGADVLTIGPHFHDCGGRTKDDQLKTTKEFVDMYNEGLRDAPTTALCSLTEDMPYARWHKLLWNGTFNTLCTLMRMDVGELQSSRGRETLLIPMMWEVWNISKAAGHLLVESEIQRLAYRLPNDCRYRPSMLLDLENGRPLELEVILGNMLKRAKELGVEAPIINTVYELLKLEKWKMQRAAVPNR
jgi:2-dehydropantoate 2-reductase